MEAKKLHFLDCLCAITPQNRDLTLFDVRRKMIEWPFAIAEPLEPVGLVGGADFGRYVNPILIRGAPYAHHIITQSPPPPIFRPSYSLLHLTLKGGSIRISENFEVTFFLRRQKKCLGITSDKEMQ